MGVGFGNQRSWALVPHLPQTPLCESGRGKCSGLTAAPPGRSGTLIAACGAARPGGKSKLLKKHRRRPVLLNLSWEGDKGKST